MRKTSKNYRAERLAEEIKKVVSEMLYRDLKDPRLSGMLSISGVEVTKDSGYATIFVSVMDDENKEDVLAAFEGAKGLFRKEVGRQVKLRHVPELRFKLDTTQEYSRHIESILEGLDIKRDEEVENPENDESSEDMNQDDTKAEDEE